MNEFIRRHGGVLVTTSQQDADEIATRVKDDRMIATGLRMKYLPRLLLLADGILVHAADPSAPEVVSVAFLTAETVPTSVEGRLEGSRNKLSTLPPMEREWHCMMRGPRTESITLDNVSREMSLGWVDSIMPATRLHAASRELAVIKAAGSAAQVLPPGGKRMQARLPALVPDAFSLIMDWLVNEHTPLRALANYKLVNHQFYQLVWLHKIRYTGGALYLGAGNAIRDPIAFFTWLARPLGSTRTGSLDATHRAVLSTTVVLKKAILPSHRRRAAYRRQQQHEWTKPSAFTPLAALSRLDLREVPLDNALVSALSALGPRFTMLALRQCRVNEDALLALVPSCTSLTALCIADNYDSLQSITRLAPLLSALIGLDISNDRLFQQESIDAVFAHCTRLQFLDMGGIVNLTRVVPVLPDLEVFYVDGCHLIGPGVERYKIDLKGCPKLRALDISQTSVTFDEYGLLSTLTQFTQLESLHLGQCSSLGATNMLDFAAHGLPSSLRYLNISGVPYEGDLAYAPLVLEMLQRPNAVLLRCPFRMSETQFLERTRYILYPYGKPVPRAAAAHAEASVADVLAGRRPRPRPVAAATTRV